MIISLKCFVRPFIVCLCALTTMSGYMRAHMAEGADEGGGSHFSLGSLGMEQEIG